MDEIVSVTRKLLSACRPEEVEVEARVRRQLVSRHSVQLLIDSLDDWQVIKYSEKRKISKHNRKCTYRSRTTADDRQSLPNSVATSPFGSDCSVTICKSSISREDVNDMWCAVHISVETQVPSMQRALDAVEPVLVTRHRATVDGHYVDVVMSDELRVEVEARNAVNFEPDEMLRVVKRVCAALQGNKLFIGYYDWKTVMHVANTAFGPFCIEKSSTRNPRR